MLIPHLSSTVLPSTLHPCRFFSPTGTVFASRIFKIDFVLIRRHFTPSQLLILCKAQTYFILEVEFRLLNRIQPNTIRLINYPKPQSLAYRRAAVFKCLLSTNAVFIFEKMTVLIYFNRHPRTFKKLSVQNEYCKLLYCWLWLIVFPSRFKTVGHPSPTYILSFLQRRHVHTQRNGFLMNALPLFM